jgi:hypothetical protein
MEEKQPLDPKDGYERTQDIVHAAVKSTISAIPIAGGPIGELFSYIFTPPWDDRRDAWIKSIEDDLRKLHSKVEGLSIEKLRENELFVSVVSQATRAALLTHEEQKLKALRNACVNAALPNSPDEDLQLIFINLLDSMTASHIQVLLFLDDPQGHLEAHGIGDLESSASFSLIPYIETVLSHAGRPSFYSLILEQLKERGLFDLHAGDGVHKLYRSHITSLGQQLVQFIKSPIEDVDEGTQEG